MVRRDVLEAALVGLQQRRARLDDKIADIRRQLETRYGRPPRNGVPAVETAAQSRQKRRRISAAARKRMAAAQKKRWAEYRKQRTT